MNKTNKRNIVELAMHYRQIVILITCCLIAFGFYGLSEMKKNEFPDFTVRQGLVIAAYPGATAEEIEEQVTKPLEDYIFSYKEVKKSKTHSKSQNGLAIVQIELNDELKNKEEFWSKFKHGINLFKNQLPTGVLAVQVMDDFGDTSALLITMESNDKTYRELKAYMDGLKDRLRRVESVGRMNVYGMQKEHISIYIDNERLSYFGISDQTIALQLFTKGFTTMSGQIKSPDYNMPIYVGRSFDTLYNIQEMIIYSDPMGNNVRLKDVARVVREYPVSDSYITNNGTKCLLLSVEMKKGKNIVQMGEDIQKQIDEYTNVLPSDVNLFKITDQRQVVDDSVTNFLHELCIAIGAVVIIVMLLLPFRVALIAASTIPISIFISLGLFYAFGIELNTVTLAALIVTLGMIVDNSIVIIDSYLELISEGCSRWHASVKSASHFFKSIFSATLAISITFFPFLFTTKGIVQDFMASFPWAITLILMISLLVAELVVPFMQFYFIRKPIKSEKKSFSFMDLLQHSYDKVLELCFRYPKGVLCIGFFSVLIGISIFTTLPQKLLPTAERNQFAIEIYTPNGTSLERTAQIADSLETILRKDKRIVSVASFRGCSSPRFHTAYAPQFGGNNFTQFIVNTTGNKATEEILNEYTPKYTNYFPDANVRFKQLIYSLASSPLEVRISGENLEDIKSIADSVTSLMHTTPGLELVRTDLNEPLAGIKVNLKEDESTRLGISNFGVEIVLSLRYTEGVPLGSVWEGDYDTPVIMKGNHADEATAEDLRNERIPTFMGLSNVPLRQIADIIPCWNNGQICHRNGIRTVTVMAEPSRSINVMEISTKLKKQIDRLDLPDGISVTYGGEYEENGEYMPQILLGLCMSVIIIFIILLWHFKRVSTASLILVCLSLCLFGAMGGVWIQGVGFGVTCILGMISLMGILVRNGIIMIDYAEELRQEEKMCVRDAIYNSAKRRMRPIFLTSAAASMGVIPMILGGSGLWMPMGTVIFYGTLITMFFILTVIPIAYWKVLSGSTRKRILNEDMELQ